MLKNSSDAKKTFSVFTPTYQNFFLFISRDDDRVEQQLWRLLDFDFGLIVPLNFLAGEVLQAHGGLE